MIKTLVTVSYTQNEGFIMGGLLSDVLYEIYKQDYETNSITYNIIYMHFISRIKHAS